MLEDLYRRALALYGGVGLWPKLALVAGLAVATTILGIAIVVYLPADHFANKAAANDRFRGRHPVVRWTWWVVRNTMGLIVLPIGLFMLVAPGPGLVFVLLGISLLDFPGKRSLERRLLARPTVLRFINDARARFRKPPFVVD